MLNDLRWIIRDGEKVLQVRKLEDVMTYPHGDFVRRLTGWQVVPVVSEEQANG